MYICRGECRSFRWSADWRAGLERAILAGMPYEYRVTEAADGTFPVELWSSKGEREQLLYKTQGFETWELAEAWIFRQGKSRCRFNMMTVLNPARE